MKTKIVFFIMMITSLSLNGQNQDFVKILEYGAKAPSGHNTQPWLFKIKEAEIEIHPNFAKSLPIVDPDNRELFVSLGCAAENICIAALHKGYKTTVSITEKGIIHIKLDKQNSKTTSPLFSQITVRQTNRSIYNGNIIPKDNINQLKTVEYEPHVKVHFFKNGTSKFDSISNLIYEGNRRQMQDKNFKAELQQWMRYNKKHQNVTRDGLSYAVFGAPNLPRFIAKSIISKAVNEKSQNKNDKKKIASSSHFILFTTQNNTIEQWINLGRTLERFLLKSTEMGLVHAYMNQPNEVLDLSQKMAVTLDIPNEYPTVLIRMGYGEKMPYSLRKKIEDLIIE